jgi:curli biogenesis system outer membrane secretion channel CsgG
MRCALPRLALLAVLALAGCGGEPAEQVDGRYSADVRKNFLDSCLENAINSAAGRADEEQLAQTCACILGKVEAEYSEQEFTEFEQRLLGGTASDAESAQLVGWSNDCAKK